MVYGGRDTDLTQREAYTPSGALCAGSSRAAGALPGRVRGRTSGTRVGVPPTEACPTMETLHRVHRTADASAAP
jgi:hypothetical protein